MIMSPLILTIATGIALLLLLGEDSRLVIAVVAGQFELLRRNEFAGGAFD